jgi:hypothetical protein
MSIRKQATAGMIIGVEDDAVLRKTAAADPPWDEKDEQELSQESDQD